MENNLVWADLEFSGLDFETNVILEIATLVTDENLEVIAEGPCLAIHHSDTVLDAMDDWNRTHHGQSGLIKRVRASSETHESAEKKTLDFLAEFCKKGASPLCGNSVHQDRQFIRHYMPGLNSFLHYRIIDVSTVKELYNRWYPGLSRFEKKQEHLALSDIRESIAELKYYRERIFRAD